MLSKNINTPQLKKKKRHVKATKSEHTMLWNTLLKAQKKKKTPQEHGINNNPLRKQTSWRKYYSSVSGCVRGDRLYPLRRLGLLGCEAEAVLSVSRVNTTLEENRQATATHNK